MTHTLHNPNTVAPPQGRYSQAVEVRPGARYLFIAGQIGVAPDGTLLETFEEQCHQIYRNILALLAEANMQPTDIVKMTVFLNDPSLSPVHGKIRAEYLGDHMPASTAVAARPVNPAWHLEVEAIAASST